MGLTETEPWSPWFSDPGTGSQIAGYSTVYEHNFTFATVKGAGHVSAAAQTLPERSSDEVAWTHSCTVLFWFL